MDTQDVDAVVIGGGIAGATAAAAIAADRSVALIEAEEAPGYHTTGRSAAIWMRNYGPPDVRQLSVLSRTFFVNPPVGFADHPLFHRRQVVTLATAAQLPALASMLTEGQAIRPADPAELARLIPALRPGYAAGGAIEDDAFDMDVAGLLHGFLRQVRARGGMVSLRSRAVRIERRFGRWHVVTSDALNLRARAVVNAAGAWADAVAGLANVEPLGLAPMRRTAALVDPAPHVVTDWPLVADVEGLWYCRPEARTRLMVSPADETPDKPHDVRPEEMDIALGIDRMQEALAIEVRRIESARAGLRTFTPDRSLAIGPDATADGFFWCAGQGGYGIQTAPAAGILLADLMAGRDPGHAAAVAAMVDPRRFARQRAA